MASKTLKQVRIINRKSGKALQAENTGNGAEVIQAEVSDSKSQLWAVEENGENMKIVHLESGKVLDVMQGGTENGSWIQVWEDVDSVSQSWKVQNVSSTYKKIVHVLSGKALDVVDMSTEEGAHVQLWEDVSGEFQQWKLAPVDARPAGKASAKKPAAKKAPAKKAAPAAKAEEKPAPVKKEAPVKKAEAGKKAAPAAKKAAAKTVEPAKKAAPKKAEKK